MVETPVRNLELLDMPVQDEPREPRPRQPRSKSGFNPGGMRPGSDYMPPIDSQFDDKENGIEYQFLDAPGLERIAHALIAELPELAHLQSRVLRGFWKRNGGKRQRKLKLGECKQPTGIDINMMPGVDYWFWIAADHVRDNGMTREAIEESIYHELCHTADSDDDEPKPIRVGHDYEGFASQIRRYGISGEDVKSIAKAIKQLPLFETGEVG